MRGIPQWGSTPITAVPARPIELWLQSWMLRPRAGHTSVGCLRILWEYSMWAGHVPVRRNLMELVTITGQPTVASSTESVHRRVSKTAGSLRQPPPLEDALFVSDFFRAQDL